MLLHFYYNLQTVSPSNFLLSAPPSNKRRPGRLFEEIRYFIFVVKLQSAFSGPMKTYLSHTRHCLLPVFNLDLQMFAFARFYFPLFCWTFFFRLSFQICGFLVFFLRFLVDIFSFAAPSPHLVTINDAHCNFPLESSCWY